MADAMVERPGLRVARLAPDAQLLLHGEPPEIAALSAAAGIGLGAAMLRVSTTGTWSALHLAEDEWLLIGPSEGRDHLASRFAKTPVPLSLVDISERSLGLAIEGPAAAMLLSTGCPLDLRDTAFPPGACTRTLFGKAAVMVWRTETGDCYRMQYGRSYDDYVTTYIQTAVEDLPVIPPAS